MIVKLCDFVQAEIIDDDQLQSKPRLGLSDLSLMVGPYRDGEDHEKHFIRTIGSGNWYRSEHDEVLFNKENLALESIWFHIPEENCQEELIQGWEMVKPCEGTLRLEAARAFQLKQATLRWIDPNGAFLISLLDSSINKHQTKYRLRIADNVDLLFVDENLCGWSLTDPVRYLVGGWDEAYLDEPENKLGKRLHDYLTLVAEPNIDNMENMDPGLLKQLEKLQTSIKAEGKLISQRRVLYEAINEVLITFYK